MKDSTKFEVLPLAGFSILSITASELIKKLNNQLKTEGKTCLLFANTNFVLQCASLKRWLNSNEVLIVNDGVGLDIAARLLHGHCYQENLNGTDFVPDLLKNLNTRRKIFLIGGRPGIAEKAATFIEHNLGQQVVGCLNGYSQITQISMLDEINRSGAEIILVAMGNPLQEEWIHTNMHALDAKLFIGVGALFDFLSGNSKRAPDWVQKIRCEWFYRLIREPKRLLRRYTADILIFAFDCIKHRVKFISQISK